MNEYFTAEEARKMALSGIDEESYSMKKDSLIWYMRNEAAGGGFSLTYQRQFSEKEYRRLVDDFPDYQIGYSPLDGVSVRW